MGVHLFLVLFLEFCSILLLIVNFYVTTPREPTCHRIFLVGLRYNRFDSMEHLEPYICVVYFTFLSSLFIIFNAPFLPLCTF